MSNFPDHPRKWMLKKRTNEHEIPVVGPELIDRSAKGSRWKRMFLIDSGTTNNTLNQEFVSRDFKSFVRKTFWPMTYDTANVDQ